MHETDGRPTVAAIDPRTRASGAAGEKITAKGRARRNGHPSIGALPGATLPAPLDPWDDACFDLPSDGARSKDHPDRRDESLVTSRQVRARIGGISAMCLWRWIRDGKFPVPIKINGRNYWGHNVVRGWVVAQAAGFRDPGGTERDDAQADSAEAARDAAQ